ncbi:MAG: arsenosugar biosynthesis radical SAM protein ArsS [Planctomycetales bacterium]|nr:arsenosugar biosynthesis radical SAM protein ArsS [Planctomycetales bacterium]
MTELTLIRQGSPLASADEQRRRLDELNIRPFGEALAETGLNPLRATGIDVLQINVGRLCNQTCAHCHVDAGPDRRESMSWQTMEDCLAAIKTARIPVLDITGGAPEMNPSFRQLVRHARTLGCRTIDRCNLTILVAPGFTDLPEFLAEHNVVIIASLPCYLAENADRQRGNGVFDQSIAAIKRLNEVGYAQPGSELKLTLVFNPIDASLPPDQRDLEAAYRHELKNRYDVDFTELITITNMPISRFLDDLVRNDELANYMTTLVNAYNPHAARGVMCRNMLSVNWDGRLHDCDFNQMLELELARDLPRHIRDFNADQLSNRHIVVGQHCYGCTAGSGSSCQGAIS